MIFKLEEKKIKIGSSLPPSDLVKDISKEMYDSTMQVFAQEGPGWAPLKSKTIAQRMRLGFGAGPILDRKHGRLGLKGGIIEAYDDTKAIVGVRTGIPYARIHQFGGTINQGARSELFVRNRYTKKPKKGLFKKGTTPGKGLTFKARIIIIPARHYLVFADALRKSILNIAKNYFKK